MLMVSPALTTIFSPRKVNSVSPSRTREHLFVIMAMRWRAAAGWNVHVDDTVATSSVIAGDKVIVLRVYEKLVAKA